MADERVQENGKTMKRRGILAAAGAVVAGIVAKHVAQPARAFTGSESNIGFFAQPAAFPPSNATLPTGHVGLAGSSTEEFGAPGTFDAGVYGYSDIGYGVYARSQASGGIAVYGESVHATGAGGVGVQGTSVNGVGVFGSSATSYGVLGASNAAHGCTGSTAAPGYAALIGQAAGNGTTAVSGTVAPGVSNAYAAQFAGPVLVNGQLIVGGGGKSAAAKHRDGTHRLLYCVESPDSWFEDFGEGTLVNGRAVVKLDPDFLGVVDASHYHVFLTGHDARSDGLAVTDRGPSSFTVQERGTGTSNGTFSWRVVAKRGDLATERLAQFAMPPPIKPVTVPPIPPAAKKP